MKDASLVLKDAVIARLQTYAPLVQINGARVFDTAPPPRAEVEQPFTSMGDPGSVPFGNDGCRGTEVTLQIDNWAQAGEWNADHVRVATQMNAATCDALFGLQITQPDGWVLHYVWIEGTRVLRDPDDVTAHGIVTVVAQLTPDIAH